MTLGLTDSSGFKLTYTPTLRDNDVGVLEIGMVSGIVVPPRPDRFQAVAFCDGSCTQEVLCSLFTGFTEYLIVAVLFIK